MARASAITIEQQELDLDLPPADMGAALRKFYLARQERTLCEKAAETAKTALKYAQMEEDLASAALSDLIGSSRGMEQ